MLDQIASRKSDHAKMRALLRRTAMQCIKADGKIPAVSLLSGA